MEVQLIPSDLQQLFVDTLDADQVITRVLGYLYTRPHDEYPISRRMFRLIGNTISYREDAIEICKQLMKAGVSSPATTIFSDIITVVKYVFFNRDPYRGFITAETKSQVEKDNGYFPYIPAGPGEFIKSVMQVQKVNYNIKMHLKFMDVGCGIGDKSLLAYLMGADSSTGIEYNKHTFELAKYFLKDTEVHLIKGDALKHKHYSDYNLVYMYNPIQKWEIELKLLEIIYEQLKPNSAILYFGGNRSWRSFKDSIGIDSDDITDFILKDNPKTTNTIR